MLAHRRNRRRALAVALVVPAALVATATAASADRHAKVSATFASRALYETHPAVTYDQASVPEGSRVRVVEKPQDKPGDAGNVTLETLRIRGLRPNREYDAYLYTVRAAPPQPPRAGAHRTGRATSTTRRMRSG